MAYHDGDGVGLAIHLVSAGVSAAQVAPDGGADHGEMDWTVGVQFRHAQSLGGAFRLLPSHYPGMPMVTHAFSVGRRMLTSMFHRLRSGALVFVVVGIGYAVLYRRDRRSPLPITGGWVDLPFDGHRP